MLKKIVGLLLLSGGLLLSLFTSAFAGGGTLQVVATQRIFADLVKQVGREKVSVQAIASPKYNVHFIQPKPSDVRKVAQADLYVNAGLDLEAWSDPLLEAAGKPELFRGRERNLDLSVGIKLLQVPQEPVSRAQGDIHLFGNPHYHMNPENARNMVRAIESKLKEMDPNNGAYYEANARMFLTRLEEKVKEWKGRCAHCRNREIISYHDDIEYFADFLGLQARQFLEPKPGIPPTPRHLEFLEDYAREHPVGAIVLPTYYSRATADKLARRIGVQVIFLAQNVGEVAHSDDFFSFFDHDVAQISEVLR